MFENPGFGTLMKKVNSGHLSETKYFIPRVPWEYGTSHSTSFERTLKGLNPSRDSGSIGYYALNNGVPKLQILDLARSSKQVNSGHFSETK